MSSPVKRNDFSKKAKARITVCAGVGGFLLKKHSSLFFLNAREKIKQVEIPSLSGKHKIKFNKCKIILFLGLLNEKNLV